jgi:two-component system chemotaxis response regulator CheY
MFPSHTYVLIAEDSAVVRGLIKSQLSQLGFKNVVEAEDGLVALKKIQEKQNEEDKIQLVIADWHMPNLSGLDLLVHIRSAAETKSIPFLMITGDQELSLVTLALSSGADDFVVKPVSEALLQERLKAIWERINKQDF